MFLKWLILMYANKINEINDNSMEIVYYHFNFCMQKCENYYWIYANAFVCKYYWCRFRTIVFQQTNQMSRILSQCLHFLLRFKSIVIWQICTLGFIRNIDYIFHSECLNLCSGIDVQSLRIDFYFNAIKHIIWHHQMLYTKEIKHCKTQITL